MIRRLVLQSLTRRTPSRAWAPFTRGRLCIFMLHRFRDPDRGIRGADPEMLVSLLESLRREDYDLVDLEEGIARLEGAARPLSRAVAFTLDDGYFDQVDVGAPLFEAFDCPSTLFAVSGFQDGRCWMWWDQVEYLMERCAPGTIDLPVGEDTIRVEVAGDDHRRAPMQRLVEALKGYPDAWRREAILELSRRCDVPLPEVPPPSYEAAGWERIRAAETRGMRCGPHSASHPVLSRLGDQRVRQEIEVSWRRVREEVRRPVPVFCYPNGKAGDYGSREVRILREAGLAAALTAQPGYATLTPARQRKEARFHLARFDFPEQEAWALQYASGLEKVKNVLLGR